MKWELIRQGVVVAAILGLATVETVRADLLIEKPPPRIEVRRDPNLKTSKLILPTIYAAAPRSLPNPKLGALPTRSSTIISGTAMSAGIALVGFVLLRKRTNLNGRILAPLVLGGVVLAAVGYAVANAPPFAPPPPAPPTALAAGFRIGDRPVEIVFDSKADKFVLILDGDAKFVDEPTR